MRSSRSALALLAKALVTPLALLVLAGLAARAVEFDPAWVFRDPVSAGGLPTYTGLISSLGNVLWMTTAAICLFAYGLLRTVADGGEQARFLLASGLLTAMLGLDDLYLFHERIAPLLLRVPEKLVLAAYGVLVAAGLVRFRQLLGSSEAILLAGALAAFSGSAAVDFAAPNRGWYHLTEDGLKFVGISLWAAFHLRFAYAAARGSGRRGRMGSVSATVLL